MATLESQINILRDEILKRRAEVRTLEEKARALALDDPEGAVTADSRAAAVRRLLPRQEEAYRQKVAAKVAQDLAAIEAAHTAEIARRLEAAAKAEPSLVEALDAFVEPWAVLVKHPLYRRLLRDAACVASLPWKELFEKLPAIFADWKDQDRTDLTRTMRLEYDRAKEDTRSAGRAMLEEIAEQVQAPAEVMA